MYPGPGSGQYVHSAVPGAMSGGPQPNQMGHNPMAMQPGHQGVAQQRMVSSSCPSSSLHHESSDDATGPDARIWAYGRSSHVRTRRDDGPSTTYDARTR